MLDTHLRKNQLTEKKEAKLVAGIEGAAKWVTCSSRTMAKLHGKLVDYSFCIQRIRPFAVLLQKFIGSPVGKAQWDEERGGLEEVQRVVTYHDLLPRIPVW